MAAEGAGFQVGNLSAGIGSCGQFGRRDTQAEFTQL
jgi:hypothetical protein